MSDTPTLNVPILDGGILLRLAGHVPIIAGLNSAGKPVPIKVNDDGSLTVSVGEGVERVVSGSLKTTSGTISAGAKSVCFVLSTDFAGTILGLTYAGGVDTSQSFEAPPGDTLSSIAYTISAGSARVLTII